MILEFKEAKGVLRLDGPENDDLVIGLCLAVDGYVAGAIGAYPDSGPVYEVVKQAARMLLIQWFDFPENAKQGIAPFGATNLLTQAQYSGGE